MFYGSALSQAQVGDPSKFGFSVSQVQIMLVVRNVQRELKQPVN
jgi:hypothetical protein